MTSESDRVESIKYEETCVEVSERYFGTGGSEQTKWLTSCSQITANFEDKSEN